MERRSREAVIGALTLGLTTLGAGACGGSRSVGTAPSTTGSAEATGSRLPPGLGGGRPASGSSVPAAATSAANPAFPRAVTSDVLGTGDRIADLDVTSQGDRVFAAWVTYVAPGGKGRRARRAHVEDAAVAPSAKVLVRAFSDQGDVLGPPVAISVRADFVGGVALAPAPTLTPSPSPAPAASASPPRASAKDTAPTRTERASPEADACLAWVGKDGPLSQVFLTKLGHAGEKGLTRVVSHSTRGTSQVALVAVREGWVVVWVDQRDDQPEVYALRVDRELRPATVERRITHTGADVSALRAISHGDDVVLAWSKQRGDRGVSDLSTTRLDASELKPRGEDTLIATTPQGCEAIELGALGEDVVAGWIEQDRADRDKGEWRSSALLARIPASGSPVPTPSRIALTASATSLALSCAAKECHVVVAASKDEVLELHGAVWTGRDVGAPPAKLATIADAAPEDVSPVLSRDWLFFGDDNLHGGGRLRRMKVRWR